MYESHFGFHRQPFQCGELARAFFVSESIRASLPQLLHAIRSDLGIAVLTGPAGVGKSSLLRHLQSLLSSDGRSIVCSGASLDVPADLLWTLHSVSQQKTGERALSAPADGQCLPTRWAVIEHLRKTTEFWGPVLLLIDDAQLVPVPILNELRALTEEEWNGRGLVRILVSGPHSFEEDLARPTHVDFSGRIRCHEFLQPLTTRESADFLSRHLEAAGGGVKDVFSTPALEFLISACGGLPRCLCLLADESLIVAAELSRKSADEDCVRRALTRLQHLPYSWNASPIGADENSFDDDPEDSGSMSRGTADSSQVTTLSAGVIEFGAPGVIEFGAVARVPETTSLVDETALAADSESVADAISDSEPDSEVEPDSEAEGGWETELVADSEPDSEAGSEAGSQPESVESFVPTAVEVGAPTRGDLSSDDSSFEVGYCFTDECGQLCGADSYAINALHGAAQSTSGPSRVSLSDEADPESGEAMSEEAEPVGVAQSGVAQSGVSQSGVSQSGVSQSGVAQSGVAQSGVAQSGVAQSGVSQSGVSQSGHSKSGHSETGAPWINRIAGDADSNWSPVFDRYTWIALGREVPPGCVTVSTTFRKQRVREEYVRFDTPQAVGVNKTQCRAASECITVTRTSDHELLASLCGHVAGDQSGKFFLFQPIPVSAASNEEAGADGQNSPQAETKPLVEAGESGRTSERAWHDGQLIFSSESPKPEIPPPAAEPREEAPAVAVTEQIVISFEAAREVERDSGQPETTPFSTEPAPEKFFTLPFEVDSIAWDRQSAQADTDDVLPLAESLASLRDEVTSFQQTGRTVFHDDPVAGSNETGSESSPASTITGGSLVARAKRRIDEMTALQSIQTIATDKHQTVATVTAQPDSAVIARELIGGGMERHNRSPDFSTLFTRLRQMKHSTAGNDS